MAELETTSTRPYFIRAIYDWCTDNGFTPHLAVKVDHTVQVPLEYVRNGEIILNIGFTATSSLELENDYIRFQARFSGSARQLIVPVNRVIAIYARENGQGMSFPITEDASDNSSTPAGNSTQHDQSPHIHLVNTSDKEQQHQKEESSKTIKHEQDKSKKPSLRLID